MKWHASDMFTDNRKIRRKATNTLTKRWAGRMERSYHGDFGRTQVPKIADPQLFLW
jgi:hypothetical protein